MAASPGQSSHSSAPTARSDAAPRQPLIPLDYCDAPNQRFYAISLLALQQSYKLFQFLESYVPPNNAPAQRYSLLVKWAIYDIVTICIVIPHLRIPRLEWPAKNRAILIAILLSLNWVVAGDWKLLSLLKATSILLPSSLTNLFQFDLAISEHRVRLRSLVDPASHILGSHTIRILPHSTAKFLLPTSEGGLQSTQYHHCVSTDQSSVFLQNRVTSLPILLNNTSPKYLQYSVQPFGESERLYFNLTAKDLKQIVSHKGWNRQHRRLSLTHLDEDDSDDDEAAELEEYDFSTSGTIGQRLIGYDGATNSDSAVGDVSTSSNQHSMISAYLRKSALQKTQSIWSFNINRPGIVRIERLIDRSDNDVRIPNPDSESSKIVIVPCPNAVFGSDKEAHSQKRGSDPVVQTACQGDSPDKVTLSADVFGYPPLKITYQRANGAARSGSKKDILSIDGIAPEGTVLLPHPASTSNDQQRKKSSGRSQQVLDQHALTMNAHEGHIRPETIKVPLNVTLTEPGTYTYSLEKVSDAFGNVLDFGLLRERLLSSSAPASETPIASDRGSKLPLVKTGGVLSRQTLKQQLESTAKRNVLVYPRSQVSFFGCGTGAPGVSGSSGAPVKLLHGKRAQLQLRTASSVSGAGITEDSPWTARLRFEPELEVDAADGTRQAVSKGWTKDIKIGKKQEFLDVDKAGRYSIVGFQGSHCNGEVYEPSECSVYTPPLPFVDVTLDPITDSCAGEVGLRAIFSLSGEPPYRLHYSVQKGHDRAIKRAKTIRASRDELELRPEQVGDFTYKFLSLDDNNYNDIRIDKTYTQTVHPLAGVQFSEKGKEKKVWSCEGTEGAEEKVKLPIDLKGLPPWSVDYRIVGQKEVVSVKDIKKTKFDLDVKIPARIAQSGGSFTVSIVRVEDGRGCSQPLAVEDLVVNVHRTRPTAAFASSRKVTVMQGETVPIGLRLTGEGPWKVSYQPPSGRPRNVNIKASNGQLLVDQAGHYELLSVSDSHCPGVVSTTSKTYDISWYEKPTVALAPGVGRLAKNGSIIRDSVCEGVDDAAAVMFTGHAPYVISYEVVEDNADGHKRKQLQELQSIQKTAQFELSTSSPGHRIYEIRGLSDATYTALTKEGLLAPEGSSKSGLLRLEQDVLARPTALFLEQDRKPVYCVKESLSESRPHTPTLKLTGLPPFRVEFEITPDGSHMSQRYSDVLIKSNEWKLELPHIFSEPGSYAIHIRNIVDATGCTKKILKGTKGTYTSLDVAEIASISAVQPQTDHCVGESIDFTLQGASPWTVVYDFNGKKQTVSSKDSRFSRIAESPGSFAIKSVAHHQDSCKSIITNIKKTIHPLPTAKVKSGSRYIENIREGDQAEIVFEFEGTPPFTFTYTKSEPVDNKHRKPKVIETHTITGVHSHTYSIYTQSEGTWAVTSVSDAYCAYPPLAVLDRWLIKDA